MGQKQIAIKLTNLLVKGLGSAGEPNVVYMLVELRKILEHEQAELKYPHLKFFADWAVHIRKDKISAPMKAMLEIAYREAADAIAKEGNLDDPSVAPVLSFAKLSEFRDELRSFLEAQNIPSDITRSDPEWKVFTHHLIQVLEGQPLVPKDGIIKDICFQGDAQGRVICSMEFRNPIAGRGTYTFRPSF